MPPLDVRAAELLKLLIDRYVRDGQPVASRTLARVMGMDLSPATIRNVMADLEDLGFVSSPHTSAGRVPTQAGYRYFVDSLLAPEPLSDAEQARIAEDLLPRVPPGNFRRLPPEDDGPPQRSIFPETLFEEIPLFLRSSLPDAIGLPSLCIRDVFWTGGSQQVFHPLLAGSYFVIVNRRVKRAVQSHLTVPWESPLCLSLMRNGTYVCSPCVAKDGKLILHSHPSSSFQPMILRNKKEAEIIGRVVAIVRRL